MDDYKRSLGKAMLGIAALSFVAEFLLQLVLAQLGYVESSWALYAVSALIIMLLVTPPVYLLIVYPVVKQAQSGTVQGLSVYDNQVLSANLDPLTQVLSKQAITVSLLEVVAQANRYGSRLSVAMADIDQLKRINIDYGRAAGDKVLQAVATTLADALRMPDRVGRYTGQDFLLVLPETSVEDASTLADRIRSRISKTPIQSDGQAISTTISFGITEFSQGEDIEHLLSRVEAAIVEAKQQGSNLVINK